MRTIFKTDPKIAGYNIELLRDGKNRHKFIVRYGAQIVENLDYDQAARELGQCIMHALTCEGRIFSTTSKG